MTATGYVSAGSGGSGGGVTSVNGDTGPTVVLDSTDVGAATAAHSHTAAAIGAATAAHTHDYAASGHTHDYAASGHTHDYAASAHTHDYAASAHTHDYAATGHAHTAADVGALYDGMDVAEAATVTINRPTTATEGSDVFEVSYNGNRGLYANGYACGRARATVANQVAFRTQAHSGAGANQSIFEVALSDNTPKLATYVNGDTDVARDINVSRDANVTGDIGAATATITGAITAASVAATGNVTGANLTPSAWQAPTFATNVSSSTAAGHAAVGARTEPFGIVRLRGRIQVSGAIAADGALATLPVGYRPEATQTYSARTSGTGAANTHVDISTAGVISCRTALGATAYVHLDGLTFVAAT